MKILSEGSWGRRRSRRSPGGFWELPVEVLYLLLGERLEDVHHREELDPVRS
jgi:hypothetical protein